jgi:crotonobetainyl-CoA:carnitine CoA-transferase CaiB-like acyl-CoA transferase
VAPLGHYTTADGVLVSIVGASEANFARLVAAMGRPELLDDPRYADVTARAEHAAEVNGEVASWAAGLPLEEVVRRCLDGGVLVGPVRTVSDLLKDPHVAARDDIVPWPLPGGSAAPQPAPQPTTDLHVDARRPAPALGEADDELWPAFGGVDADELNALRDQGVVAPLGRTKLSWA